MEVPASIQRQEKDVQKKRSRKRGPEKEVKKKTFKKKRTRKRCQEREVKKTMDHSNISNSPSTCGSGLTVFLTK